MANEGTDFLELMHDKAPDGDVTTTFGTDLPPAKGEEGQPKQTGDAPTTDKAPNPELEKVLQELAEQRKFNGRLTTELGELRKSVKTQETAAPAPSVEVPDVPLRDQFETDAEYAQAMKAWVVDSHKAVGTADKKLTTEQEYEKAWKDSGLTDEEIEETLAFWQNPTNASPLKLRAAMESLQDPKKDLRDVMNRLQKLALRDGVPTTSGLTPASGVTETGAMAADEVASFNKAMALPSVHDQERAIKAHEKRFGRFVKPR